MKYRIASLVVTVALLVPFLVAYAETPPADFCQRHPSNPQCQPTPTPTPTPAPTPTPTPSPTPSPTPTPAPTPTPTPPGCSSSLQAAINAAAIGSTLDVTGCTFHERATINKSMTLRGGTVDATGLSIPLQQGALIVGADTVTVDGTRVENSSGAGLDVSNHQHVVITNCELDHNRQEGYHVTGVNDVRFAGCHIHDNNAPTQAQPPSNPQGPILIQSGGGITPMHNGWWWPVDPGWEAGGGKATSSTNVTFDNNEVDHNGGPGIWFDINGNQVTVTNNHVHHNGLAGIMFEISTGANISSNALWENGWDSPYNDGWAWGANILLSTVKSAVATGNVSAWSFGGGMIVSQNRPEFPNNSSQTGNSITGNTIAASSGHTVAQYGEDWANPAPDGVVSPNTTVGAGSPALAAAGIPANPESGH